jgi:hypothetical protein
MIVFGCCMTFLALATPLTCGGCLSGEWDGRGFWDPIIASTLVSVLSVCILIYRRFKDRRWAAAAFAVGTYNMLGFPALVTLQLQTTASLGMPILIFTFWISVALILILLVLILAPERISSFATGALTGGIGLGGLALLLTQFGSASEGYEAVIPVIVRDDGKPLKVREDFELTMRFDSSFVQKAYFEKGLWRVTRPPYYRVARSVVRFDSQPDNAIVLKNTAEDFDVYAQAMKGLVTLGLVKQYDVNLGLPFGDRHSAPPTSKPTTEPTKTPAPTATSAPQP